ncbi:MAG: hypothetical protein IJ874_10010 [Ruminococcus sp.]|nr:hypothetical protein [Ruminococcus sp.]
MQNVKKHTLTRTSGEKRSKRLKKAEKKRRTRRPLRPGGLIMAAAAFMLAAAYFLIVPGLGDRFRVKSRFPGAEDIVLADYPYYGSDIPESFITISGGGMTIKAPEDIVLSPSDTDSLMYMTSGRREVVLIYPPEPVDAPVAGQLQRRDGSRPSQYELSGCCAALETAYPANVYELERLCLSLSKSDCNIRSKEVSAAYYGLSELKYGLLGGDLAGGTLYSDVWSYDRGNIIGFVYRLDTAEDEGEAYLAQLYQKGSCDTRYSVLLRAEDPETVRCELASLHIERVPEGRQQTAENTDE